MEGNRTLLHELWLPDVTMKDSIHFSFLRCPAQGNLAFTTFEAKIIYTSLCYYCSRSLTYLTLLLFLFCNLLCDDITECLMSHHTHWSEHEVLFKVLVYPSERHSERDGRSRIISRGTNTTFPMSECTLIKVCLVILNHSYSIFLNAFDSTKSVAAICSTPSREQQWASI